MFIRSNSLGPWRSGWDARERLWGTAAPSAICVRSRRRSSRSDRPRFGFILCFSRLQICDVLEFTRLQFAVDPKFHIALFRRRFLQEDEFCWGSKPLGRTEFWSIESLFTEQTTVASMVVFSLSPTWRKGESKAYFFSELMSLLLRWPIRFQAVSKSNSWSHCSDKRFESSRPHNLILWPGVFHLVARSSW